MLTSGRYGKITNAIGTFLLLYIMGIAIYIEQKTQDSTLWTVFAFLVLVVPYRWLIWSKTQFTPLAANSDTLDSVKTPATWLPPGFPESKKRDGMGMALIYLGLFLWFALGVNGSVGRPIVNYSFFASALFMVIAGSLKITNSKWGIARYFCAAALISYLPMIWQRFHFKFGTDWGGIYFDIAIVVFMLVCLSSKPNNS